MTLLPPNYLYKFRSTTVVSCRRVGVRAGGEARRWRLGSRGVVIDGIAGRAEDDAWAPVSCAFCPFFLVFCLFFRRLV
jgi:hypothetical protein